MRRLLRICLVFSIAPLLLGCKKDVDEAAAFTLETGLDSEVGICIEERPPLVSIQESGTSQVVNLIWEFPCGAKIDKPYLTVARNGGATLVFNSDYGKSHCACARSITVKINNRLKGGDTLYIVVNKEVVGHKLLAASEGK
ncbi:hypothetical protein [Paenacidovorax monticola]|uniref:Lipoprotein n=1 Tax=Paenacidovorax monticola TaxID=1926868 RepID=A0A7H0HHC0_9BURK|nr:hypothetical protein [Paenacidovorax monticola]QNP59936.1 hypothetical protein H9L24_02945 [Paenacidovorax monticola]